MNLDIVAGALCGWLALCVFSLHVVSSPRRRNWMNIPEYVRRGLLVTGGMFTWRSVNFLSVAGSGVLLGHINAEGIMALAAMTYTITSLAFWAASAVLPDLAWQRLDWVRGRFKAKTGEVPVMVTIQEMVDIQHATGQAAIGPNEAPEAALRETPRFIRQGHHLKDEADD